MFKALLLSVWYDLSDVKLAEALDDRASFRRFCGFSRERGDAGAHRLRAVSPGAGRRTVWIASCSRRSPAELKARGITVKTGTLVDATIIASASEEDGDARWVKHKGRAEPFMASRPMSAPMPTRLWSRRSAVTPANVNDGRAGPAGPARRSRRGVCRQRLSRRCISAMPFAPRAERRASRPPRCGAGDERRDACESLKRWNAPIHRVRCRIEKIFGTWKRSYGLRRMRWRGLAKPRCKFVSPPSPTISNDLSLHAPQPA